jgi:AcrR family transcriptional regulator
MQRRPSDKAFRSRERLKRAAVSLFHERGYHATSVRRLAARAGLDGASVYYHFPSKQRLLVSILEGVMNDLIATVERAVSKAGPSPAEQLRAAIVANAFFHGSSPREAAISDTELRGLSRANLAKVIALRDQHERIFREILERGHDQGLWHTDVRLACFIIMAICNEISHWYRPAGRLSLHQIAAFDADFVMSALTGNST